MRKLYEVRVRECTKPGHFSEGRWIEGIFQKKSKFYQAKSSSDAAGKYKGKGTIMSVEKASKDKMLGVGSFFKLGDVLLRKISEDGATRTKEERTKRFQRRKRKDLAAGGF